MKREKVLNVISLGAGVQSSCLALMAAAGEIKPMPDCAIFANTGWERQATYAWLDQLELALPFPVHRVQAGNIKSDHLVVGANLAAGKKRPAGERWASMPFFTGGHGVRKEGMIKRQCTADYKIKPIEKKVRGLLGLKPGAWWPKTHCVSQWIGMSIDEASRMKPSRRAAILHRYPLAMEKRMSRQDCKDWMVRAGFPAIPRSSCVGCPFHGDKDWRSMREESPDEFADAVDFDAKMRWAAGEATFLHRSLTPIAEAVEDADKAAKSTGDMFGAECSGFCGI